MQKTATKSPPIHLVGISVRTSYSQEKDQKSSKLVPCMQRYFQEALFDKIPRRKKPGTTFCVYTDYESNYQGAYTYFIGEEVESFDRFLPEGLQKLIIPEQEYVKFTPAAAPMPNVVIHAWENIWDSATEKGGRRRYEADFEVYDERACDPQSTTLDIYVGVHL